MLTLRVASLSAIELSVQERYTGLAIRYLNQNFDISDIRERSQKTSSSLRGMGFGKDDGEGGVGLKIT